MRFLAVGDSVYTVRLRVGFVVVLGGKDSNLFHRFVCIDSVGVFQVFVAIVFRGVHMRWVCKWQEVC